MTTFITAHNFRDNLGKLYRKIKLDGPLIETAKT